MWLTRVFIERPTLIFVFVAVTLIAGILALRSLVVQENPNTGLPSVNIAVNYSGASTSELSDAIVGPIENQLAGTADLQHINSTIQTGSAQIAASFALGSSQSQNLTNVQRALQAAQGQLPQDLVAPTIRSANPSEPVVVSIALTSKKLDQSALAQLAKNAIAPAIEQVQGVSNVNIKGQTQGAYEVLADPALLAASNLTITDLIGSISANNLRAPGGIVYQPGRETQLDVRGDITDPASLAALPVRIASASGPTVSSSGTGGQGTSPAGASGSGGAPAAASSGGTNGATGPGNAVTGGPTLHVPTSALFSRSGIIVSGRIPLSNGATPTPAPTTSSGAAALPAQTMPTGSGTAAGSSTTAAQNGTNTATGTNAAGATNASGGSATAGGTANGFAGSSVTNGSPGGSSAANGRLTAATSTTAIGAAAQVNNDTPVTVQGPAAATTGGLSQASAASATVNVPNILGGSGIATSNFVGALATWALPASDKRVADLARVQSGSVPVRVYTDVNGKMGIGLDIQKATNASEVTVSDDVIALLPSLRAQFPSVNFTVEHVQSTYTREQVDGVERTLLEGVWLIAIVMLFFLRSWRNAVVVMVAIPTSLGVTLFAMKAFGLTLDTISLLAMTLIIGLLVDDSTVVLENIERHRADGEESAVAALRGRTEIGTAALVITLVDVVVFLPIAFLSGPVGKQLSEFGIVVSVATLTSLLVSFTITPTLAGLWALESTWKPWPIVDRFSAGLEWARKAYAERLLPVAIARPWPIVIVAVLSLGGALFLVPTGIVGEEYTPAGDQGEIFLQATFGAGTPLEHTKAEIARVEKHVLAIGSDLEAEETAAGGYDAVFGGFVQEGNVAQVHIWLRTSHKTPTDLWVSRLQAEAHREMPDASIVVKPASAQSGGPKQPIDELISISGGGDPTPYARRIEKVLRATPGTQNVQDSATNVTPQMAVEFDRDMARELDVSIGDTATAIRAAFGGTQATQIETSQGLIEIEVIYPRADQTRLADVLRIPIRSQNGMIVHVGDVAHLRYAPASLLITREDRAEVVHVSANVASNYQLSNVVADFQQRIAKLNLPKGVTLHPAAQGQQDLMKQTLSVLGTSLSLSIVFVFLLMVALYNSYRTPFTIMFAVPLAVVGALGALAITRQTLNLYSLIGTVLLVGLVTKNGILLVDFADTLRERGRSKLEAIRESGATRFRPILMTTVAMVAGMLPLAIGIDPGASTRKSLGIVVIGGLTSSLILTLLIVPIAYMWIAPRERKAARNLERDARNAGEPAASGRA